MKTAQKTPRVPVYQQADQEGMYRAVSEPALREAQQH